MSDSIHSQKSMERYLIETPHTAQDCQMLVDQLHAMGYLHHFDWGCPYGVHTGWAVIEAENEEQAQLAVPSLVRKKARIIQVTKFYGSDLPFHGMDDEKAPPVSKTSEA